MQPNILGALLAIAAVLSGAIITGGFTIWVDRRKERREIERDRRSKEIEVKRAGRLIDADLLFGKAAATICIEDRHWWTSDLKLSTEGWNQYRGILAPELSKDAWRALQIAVLAVQHLESARSNAIETEPIVDSIAETLVPMLKDIEGGRQALTPIVN